MHGHTGDNIAFKSWLWQTESVLWVWVSTCLKLHFKRILLQEFLEDHPDSIPGRRFSRYIMSSTTKLVLAVRILSRLLLTSPLHWLLLPLYISSPQSSQKWSQNIICLKIGFSLQNPPLVFLKENVMQMPSHGLTELGVIKPDSSSSKSCLTYHCPLCLIHSNHTDFLAFLWTCLRAFALAGTSVGHFPFPQIFTCLTLSFPLSIFSNATSPEKLSLIPHHLVTLCSQLCFIFLHYS